MPAEVDAHDLVSAARDVMRIEHESTAGLWPRAAALLARQGLELAMRDRTPIPHPMVVAREARLAVMGPPERARAGCQFLAASMVAQGLKTAVCVQPQAAAPKS